MKKHFRKVVITLCTVALIISATTLVYASNNRDNYAGDTLWTTRRWYGDIDYWKQSNYYKNKNYYWIVTLKYLCNPLYWDHSSTSQTIGVSQGVTVGKTDSISLARSRGMSVPTQAGNITASDTYTYSAAFTVSAQMSQQYSAQLTKSDRKGYYVWEARNEFYEFNTELYWRPNTRSGWSFQRYGEGIAFRYQKPYIMLVRTDENPY